MTKAHGTDSCCGHGISGHGSSVASCCCGMQRRFPSKAERRKALEEYREQLKNELAGVDERLEEISQPDAEGVTIPSAPTWRDGWPGDRERHVLGRATLTRYSSSIQFLRASRGGGA